MAIDKASTQITIAYEWDRVYAVDDDKTDVSTPHASTHLHQQEQRPLTHRH